LHICFVITDSKLGNSSIDIFEDDIFYQFFDGGEFGALIYFFIFIIGYPVDKPGSSGDI